MMNKQLYTPDELVDKYPAVNWSKYDIAILARLNLVKSFRKDKVLFIDENSYLDLLRYRNSLVMVKV